MNKNIKQSVKVAVTAEALAAALTGCCMFGTKNCYCKEKCCGKKTGVNTLIEQEHEMLTHKARGQRFQMANKSH